MANAPAKTPIVDVQNVVKKFAVGNTEVTILKGISFKVYAGEFVIIVGPSGNGKSTLLNMCTGIDYPNNGAVLVTGENIHDMNANRQSLWRGKNVGIVFQFFQMMPTLTLFNNVMLPMELAGKYSGKERKERAEYLLELVQLKEQMHKLPSMVSGGQQQRAAISRALANDPPLLIADEPTGNLDPTSAGLVFNIFKKLVDEGKTIMMVTHDKELAAQVSRQIEIVNGKISRDEFRQRQDWAGS
ncbi:MAG: Lipoprotein-releasing system ATP-binding protein LolD [Anaerolineae bacterium]|nr:Lipoprotein-releasing system ATP-binding protein LolD [Anaerolineae bacterium]